MDCETAPQDQGYATFLFAGRRTANQSRTSPSRWTPKHPNTRRFEAPSWCTFACTAARGPSSCANSPSWRFRAGGTGCSADNRRFPLASAFCCLRHRKGREWMREIKCCKFTDREMRLVQYFVHDILYGTKKMRNLMRAGRVGPKAYFRFGWCN